MSKAGSKSMWSGSTQNGTDSIDWELRPGGMLVQKRDPNADSLLAGPMIKLKVSHGLSIHEATISPQATFGDLKKILVQETGLQPKEQRLFYRGKEKDSNHFLQDAGVKEKSKIILVEDSVSRERRLQEMRRNEEIQNACKAVADVKQEVDKLAGQIPILEGVVLNGGKVPDHDFTMLTETLMCQLLKLDAIKAVGDAKLQRRIQVRTVQNYVEAVDGLKVRNAAPNCLNSTVVTTKWETFDSGVGSLTAPPPSTSAAIMADWERFD